MKRILLIALVAVLAVSVFAGCAPASNGTDTPSANEEYVKMGEEAAKNGDESLKNVMDKGEFIVGLDDSFPPMGFRDEDGNLTGFDIELAQAVAAHMGVKANLQAIDWKAKELELESGNIDMIWNGYTITPERQAQVLMSEPYMENMQVVVVPADSSIKTLADLAGKKVAVQDGSSAQEAIADNAELAASIGEQIDFKDNVTALMDVSSGQTDALAVDLVVANYYLAKDPDKYVILEETLSPEQYGIGFRKSDQALHDAIMQALSEMKEDGTATKLSEKWFGKDVTTF
ncbi:amino acid ABC transporter substrate-binding protein [Christensenella intestinihominis]|uniref:amino acid ABC transporter substrate-binding protein n=1 Tax=Christensenella intestinihominis TaxID=1851429 RepID=UPI00083381B9|nr:amino acid ABC transporter substrate-binding protein [Christensenella intestinihominis]